VDDALLKKKEIKGIKRPMLKSSNNAFIIINKKHKNKNLFSSLFVIL
jgi:hypothetical protein